MAIGDTMDTLTMDLAMDTGEEKGDLLNLNQSPKLSLTQTHGTDTMDLAMDTGEEKGDLLNLNQSPKLR